MTEDFQFFDPVASSGARRSELLRAAAEAAESLQHFAGPGESGALDEGAAALREVMHDEIVFSEQPEVYPVNAEEVLKKANLPMSIAASDYGANFKHFLVTFPFDVQPAGPWNFNQLKLEIKFRAGENERLPKVQALFPETRFQEVLKADGSLEIGLTPSLEFGVKTGDLHYQVGPMSATAAAGVGAVAKGHAGVSAGPFLLNWKKAIVKTSQTGLEWAWWQIGGADLKRGDSPPFMVVLQVPAASTQLTAVARVQATRYYNLIRNAFKNITNWSKVYREFVEAGLPYLRESIVWDLSKDIARGN
jgi:hypothetical protein